MFDRQITSSSTVSKPAKGPYQRAASQLAVPITTSAAASDGQRAWP